MGLEFLSHPLLFLVTTSVYLLHLKKIVKAKRHLHSTDIKKNEICVQRKQFPKYIDI